MEKVFYTSVSLFILFHVLSLMAGPLDVSLHRSGPRSEAMSMTYMRCHLRWYGQDREPRFLVFAIYHILKTSALPLVPRRGGHSIINLLSTSEAELTPRWDKIPFYTKQYLIGITSHQLLLNLDGKQRLRANSIGF